MIINNNLIKKIDNSKILNSRCVCTRGLPWIKEEVIMMDPCEHLIHKKCFNKMKTTVCPYCRTNISRIISTNDFKYDKRLYQKCIDILSVSNFDKMSRIYSDQVLTNLPNLIGAVINISVAKGANAGKKICEDVFSMNNIEIKVRGLGKLKGKENEPKVFIANHTSHLDFFVIFYVLKTGFLSSSAVKDNLISNRLTKILPLLIIDRGKKGNSTVDKMKEYVTKYKSICLFPEGMLTHPNALIRFRTGAFHIGYPVYPIVLKYSRVVSDMSASNFILKIASKQKEIIEMHILDPFYPPFDENKIELVRNAMAERGDFLLSRVSNRDIREEN